MFSVKSARKRFLKKKRGSWLWRGNGRSLLRDRELRPRIGIRIWLTALFVLVTAFAGITAYEIVRPILEDTLDRAGRASFDQVAKQFQREINKDSELTVQRIQNFATSRGLQWGIVQAAGGRQIEGNLEVWNPRVVERAVRPPSRPQIERETIETGVRKNQVRFTYAVPIDARRVTGEKGTAVVFVKYFTESDVENVEAAMRKIDRIALLAGALALLIAGFAGYIAADLISRRLSRLGVAAERLAAGNFDERIETRIEDEVGSLGSTFNAMAASLKGAFEQVKQEKERGQAILDGMTDAVVGVDRHLNAIFLNPRARELLEHSPREFHTRLQEVLAKSRYAGPVTEPAAQAGDRIIEIRAAPLEDGALAIMRDVTEQRRIERAKAEFVANASHELKTPLFALSGYLEMLEDEKDEKVRAEFLKDMRAQTERLQSLALTLLDLSRLDANAVTFRVEETDLEELLYELKRDFGYTGRQINIHADKDLPPVETDPTQLHRALAILVDNAIKYSDENSPVDLALRREEDSAVISVTDRGCGIPEDEQRHIFERFYRAQGSSRANGTGLGLALANEITTHLGGRIEVESEPGAGSTFSVVLPLAGDAPEREARGTPNLAHPKS